ncbi:MAG: hypothetical protein Q7S33_05220 [Nanoarchaeota archaeon]|nr:hypothetical protein [Nanoarchaeota archaeon]
MGLLDLFKKREHRAKYESALRKKERKADAVDSVLDRVCSHNPDDRYDYGNFGRGVITTMIDYEDARGNYYDAKERLDKLYEQGQKEAIKLDKQYNTLFTKLGKDAKEVYDFERKKLGMHQKSDNTGLVGITSILGIVAGIFFLSANITGNVISDLTQTSSNVLGAALFIAGIAVAFFYFKTR